MVSIPTSRLFSGMQSVGKSLGGIALVLTATAQLIELAQRVRKDNVRPSAERRKEK